MKILQLGKFYPIGGGVEKVMLDLTAGMSERGADCDMMCASADGGGTHTVHLNGHAELICCRSIGKFASTMISPAMLQVLKGRCGRYDIIHVHHPDPMACLALYCSGYRGKVVLHWHSDILRQRILGRLYRPLQNWLTDRADVIIGTSPVYIENSEDLKRVRAKSCCIPIGVRPVPYCPAAVQDIRTEYAGKKIIFSLGRLIGYKGHGVLVEAARYLDDSHVIVIGGTGPLKSDLERQIRASGLDGRVKLSGFMPDDVLSAWYHACDVFCLSSIQKTEAFGIAQIEAMSCGKPVVATNIPGSGVSWVNLHGFSGLNVEPGNPYALAGAIRTITSEKEKYDEFSENAGSRYVSMFTLGKMIDSCMDLYEELFDGK